MSRFLALLASLLLASPVAAADFSFASDDGSVNPFTFSIGTSRPPDVMDPGKSFTILAVTTTEQGPFSPLVYPADYTFHTTADFGGFENGFVAYFGPQMFSGTTAAPTFVNGIYILSDFAGGPRVATLTITNAAAATPVPEPATWALMLGGAGLAGAGLRRRRPLAPA